MSFGYVFKHVTGVFNSLAFSAAMIFSATNTCTIVMFCVIAPGITSANTPVMGIHGIKCHCGPLCDNDHVHSGGIHCLWPGGCRTWSIPQWSLLRRIPVYIPHKFSGGWHGIVSVVIEFFKVVLMSVLRMPPWHENEKSGVAYPLLEWWFLSVSLYCLHNFPLFFCCEKQTGMIDANICGRTQGASGLRHAVPAAIAHRAKLCLFLKFLCQRSSFRVLPALCSGTYKERMWFRNTHRLHRVDAYRVLHSPMMCLCRMPQKSFPNY